MKYQIIVNEKQARIISNALDVCSRLEGGQFETVLDRFNWKKLNSEEKDKIEEMLTDLKCMLTGVERNAYLGIGQISDDGQVARVQIFKLKKQYPLLFIVLGRLNQAQCLP